MIAVLRATQLGLLDRELVKAASKRQDRKGAEMIDADAVCRQVKKYLGNFDPENIAKL